MEEICTVGTIHRESTIGATWILRGSYHAMNVFSIQGPEQWETIQANFPLFSCLVFHINT